jgi:hypothetical protein
LELRLHVRYYDLGTCGWRTSIVLRQKYKLGVGAQLLGYSDNVNINNRERGRERERENWLVERLFQFIMLYSDGDGRVTFECGALVENLNVGEKPALMRLCAI